MLLFDTHAHLNLPPLCNETEAVLARARGAGVARILCVGTDAHSSAQAVQLARRFPEHILASVGVHPNHGMEDDWDRVEELATQAEVAAIGETGLDYHWDYTPPEVQRVLFRRHIDIALRLGKPLIIHSRKSNDDVLTTLREAGRELVGVKHCFSSSAQVAREYIDLGLFVSFAGNITRPGHRKLKAAALSIPEERLLVETDAPYLLPEGVEAEANEPAYVVHTLEALSAIRGTTLEALAERTTENALRLFGNRPD